MGEQPQPARSGALSSGQGTVEYIIISIVVAIVIIAVVRYLGGSVGGQFRSVSQRIARIGDRDSAGYGADTEERSDTRSELLNGSTVDVEPDSGRRYARTRGGSEAQGSGSAVYEDPQNLERRVDELSRRVGDDDGRVVEDVEIDWWAIGIMAFMVFGAGVYLVFRLKKKGRPKKQRIKLVRAKDDGPANDSGQVLVIGVIVILGLTMAAITVANIGMMVAEKIHLQDTVDAAAYSAAVVEARYMNLTAYINRAMVANYDSMAFNTAMWAVVDGDDHGLAVVCDLLYKLSEVLLLSVYGSPLSEPVDAIADVLRAVHDVLHEFNALLYKLFSQDEQDLSQYLEKYNTYVLTMYHGILYAAMQSSRHRVVQQVAARMDPEVKMSTLLELGAETVSYNELERAVDFVIEDEDARGWPWSSLNSTFNDLAGTEANTNDHPLLLAAVTEASLDPFSAGRDRSGQPDLLRQFNSQSLLDYMGIGDALELAFEIPCVPLCVAACPLGCVDEFYDPSCTPRCIANCPDYCDVDVSMKIGASMRDFQEETSSRDHIPFYSRKRMREVNFFGVDFRLDSRWPVFQLIKAAIEAFGIRLSQTQGYTSGNRWTDVANVANAMIGFNGFTTWERAWACMQSGTGCQISFALPTGGLNALNVIAAATMIPPVIPPFVDAHWDGIGDAKPVHAHQVYDPATGRVAAAEYLVEIEGGEEVYEGVPAYKLDVELPNVGISHYHYRSNANFQTLPQVFRSFMDSTGAVTTYSVEGPSVAVIGVKDAADINGLRGLGIGLEEPFDYSMSAIARAQVYYLMNPLRPNERPSLFNPHWVARLAPIDSPDSQVLMREGLPFVASIGVPLVPTH